MVAKPVRAIANAIINKVSILIFLVHKLYKPQISRGVYLLKVSIKNFYIPSESKNQTK